MGEWPGGGLRKLEQGILVDSGAGVTIADGEKIFPDYALESSPGSIKGQRYVGPGKDVIVNRGQRRVQLRLGSANGPRAKTKFQDAAVRRPILSVGESTEAGNMVIFDKEESAILPVGAAEIAEIRRLLKKVKSRLTMKREKNTFKLDAWVEAPPSQTTQSGFGR